MAQQALTKGLYLDPLASGRLDREKSHEIP